MMKFIMPTFLFNIEKWKWNDEYRVYVSNMGHFKDEHKKDLAVKIDNGGYCRIFTNLGYKSAHRIVMLTWKPIPDAENLTVDHLDHNKRNNALSNLEWVTAIENRVRASRDQLKGKESEWNKPIVNVNIETVNVTVRNTPYGLSMADKNRQVENKANYQRPISDGSRVFNNARAAATYYINKRKMQDVKAKKVEKRIIAAIFFGKEYMDTKWYFTEEE